MLLAGGAAGLLIGWLILRRARPLLGSIIGMVAGMTVAVIGVFAYAGSIAP